jgi:hypothetical protein
MGAKTAKTDDSMKAYLDFLKQIQVAQDKLNGSKKKQLTTEQKIINAMLKNYDMKLMTPEREAKATAKAIQENLDRQKMIANSPTVSLAAQGDGSAGGNSIINSGTPNVNVTITTPHGTADDYTVDLRNRNAVIARRQGRPTILAK